MTTSKTSKQLRGMCLIYYKTVTAFRRSVALHLARERRENIRRIIRVVITFSEETGKQTAQIRYRDIVLCELDTLEGAVSKLKRFRWLNRHAIWYYHQHSLSVRLAIYTSCATRTSEQCSSHTTARNARDTLLILLRQSSPWNCQTTAVIMNVCALASTANWQNDHKL